MSGGHNTITYRNFRNFNRINFRNYIISQNWNEIVNLTDPNKMWLKWKSSFLSIVDKHCPLRTMRVRARSCLWITSDLNKQMHDRNVLKIKAIKSNDHDDWMRFKKQRNLVNSQIRSSKQNYYLNNFNEYTGDSRKTWQTINELTSRKSGKKSVTSLKLNGVSLTNPTILSNKFNNHFATIGPKLAEKVDPLNTHSFLDYLTSTDKQFKLRPTTANKVFHSLIN